MSMLLSLVHYMYMHPFLLGCVPWQIGVCCVLYVPLTCVTLNPGSSITVLSWEEQQRHVDIWICSFFFLISKSSLSIIIPYIIYVWSFFFIFDNIPSFWVYIWRTFMGDRWQVTGNSWLEHQVHRFNILRTHLTLRVHTWAWMYY